MKKSFLTFISICLCLNANSQLCINELMQSNIDCVMDDLNEFPDSWVELYNISGSVVDLNQYKIGETNDASKAWQLPSQNITPHGFALIYCDNTGSGIHTDFRIDIGKGAAIYLFKDDQIVDSICDLKKQPAPNISFGRIKEGTSEWGYQETPTPKAKNCGNLCTEILDDPVFDIHGGIFTNIKSINLTISLPESAPVGTVVRYTTDGSEPTASSSAAENTLHLSSNTIVRAKLFCEGFLSKPSKTESYIFFNRELTLPVVSICTDKTYLYDNKKGIYVEGTYNSNKKNYEYNWRRPINFEYFENANEESKLNQICETRISGAASRGFKFKSLALYANKRFGAKRFDYEFFPDQKPGETDFKSIVLRNAGNDFDYLYMRDAIAQLTFAKKTDIDYQAWRPVIIYINGTYSGIINIRERANEENVYTNYDGLEDIDLVENWGSIKEGDNVNLNAFKNFYTEHGHTWDEYAKWMDLDEFINYWTMECYFNNIDFPSNNLIMWRPRTDEGRWRFIAKDVDYIMGIYNQQAYNYAYFNWLNNNSYDSNYSWGNTYDATRLFRRLMEDNDFKREFTDRFAIYMGDFLNYDRIWEDTWEPMYNIIKTEYPNHRVLINQWWPKYTDELSSAQTWVKKRTDYLYSHIASYYSLGTPETMTINSSLNDEQKKDIIITVNDIKLSNSSFNGKFYKDNSISLSGSCNDNANTTVTGWSIIKVTSSGSTSTTNIDTPDYTFTMPDCSRLIINAKLGTYDDIEITKINDSKEITAYYDIHGIKHNSPVSGINIIHYKDGSTKKIKM